MTDRPKERWFNWKFLLVLFALLALIYVLFSAVESVQANSVKDAQNTQLIKTNDQLIATAVIERKEAAKERRELLEYTKDLAQRQRAILQYLSRHGIELPARLLSPVPAPSFTRTVTSSKPPKGTAGHSSSKPTHGKGHPKHSTGHHKGRHKK